MKKLPRIKRKCLQCGKEFECLENVKQKFCSFKCYNNSNIRSEIAKKRGLGKYKRTEENKKNNKSLWRKGHIPWNKNKQLPQWIKDKVSLGVKNYISKNGYSFLKTIPHLKLKQAMINDQIYKGFTTEGLFECDKFSLNIDEVDFTRRIAIFVDGTFWHGHKSIFPNIHEMHPVIKSTIKQIHIKDRNISNYLKFKGYKVLRFWEHEINEEIEKCLVKIKSVLKR